MIEKRVSSRRASDAMYVGEQGLLLDRMNQTNNIVSGRRPTDSGQRQGRGES